MALRSFADELTEEVYHGVYTHAVRKKFASGEIVKSAQRRLDILNCIDDLETLKLIPLYKEENGVRDAHGKNSIPINKNERIAFRIDKGNVEDVEIKF